MTSPRLPAPRHLEYPVAGPDGPQGVGRSGPLLWPLPIWYSHSLTTLPTGQLRGSCNCHHHRVLGQVFGRFLPLLAHLKGWQIMANELWPEVVGQNHRILASGRHPAAPWATCSVLLGQGLLWLTKLTPMVLHWEYSRLQLKGTYYAKLTFSLLLYVYLRIRSASPPLKRKFRQLSQCFVICKVKKWVCKRAVWISPGLWRNRPGYSRPCTWYLRPY